MNRSEQKTVLEAFRKTLGQERHNLKIKRGYTNDRVK